ncbi:MAG: hypothetical protein ACI84C_000400 [Flavobacteriales bacterium]|jgi:hypothetical protein
MRIAILSVILLLGLQLHAQYAEPEEEEKEKTSFKDRLYFGGGIQASFGNQVTVLGLAPLVGYKWTDKFSTGLGINYTYFSVRSSVGRLTSSIYGGHVFGRYIFFENFFAQSEFHLVSSDVPQYDDLTRTFTQGRLTIPMLYVGAGYRVSLGGRVYATLSVLYDVIDHRYSPYSNPFMRGGIAIGL